MEQIKYLGLILMDNASIASDFRCCGSFLGYINGMYHKFKFLNSNVLNFLFISYCMSLFGIKMGYDKLESQKQHKQ